MVVFHRSVNFNSDNRLSIKQDYNYYSSLWLSCLCKVILKAWRINIKKLRCAIAIQACKSIAKES